MSVVAARPPSTGHWDEGEGDWFPPGRRVKTKHGAVFHLVFIWMLSLLLVCLLLWNSVISLIMKFKYINFYLVYKYLLNFSVCESVCERVCERVMHVADCVRTIWGHVVLKTVVHWEFGWASVSSETARNLLIPSIECPLVCVYVNQCHCYEV